MSKYISLGTMSGTSMDGIDLSIINSDGESGTSIIDNFFYQYSSEFKKELIIERSIPSIEVPLIVPREM